MAEASSACALRLHNVSLSFADRPVVSNVNLQLEAGTFFSLAGPSAGGKTTLLKLIGGYLQPTAGHIHLRQRDVTLLPPERRDIGMVFQSYALFPHMTALVIEPSLLLLDEPLANRDRHLRAEAFWRILEPDPPSLSLIAEQARSSAL